MDLERDMTPVLIVDHDELSRHVMVRRVMRWGYDPVAFTRSEDALLHLQKRPARALVADLHLPEMDGLALARAALVMQPGLPVLLLAAHPTPEQWERAADAGARDLLTKQAGGAEAVRLALASALECDAAGENAALAHSLRTPLTALKGALDILCSGQLGELPEAQRRFAGIAQRNADKMIALVEELLETAARP